MFNINFSLYGSFIVIILILISFISMWVVKSNIKYKNEDINTSINTNSIKFSKIISDSEGYRIQFESKGPNWWFSSFNVAKKIIYIEQKAFHSSSIYNQVNTLFKTLFMIELIKHKKNYNRNNIIFKTILILLVINFIWTILFSLWIISALLFICIISEFIIENICYKKIIKNTIIKTKKLLIEGVTSKEKNDINRYIKYKSLIIFVKYISVFFEPILSLFVLFKEWGKNE